VRRGPAAAIDTATVVTSVAVPINVSSRESLAQCGDDLAALREAVYGALREDQLAVEPHVEDSAAALDELRRDAELFFDLRRQTGGAGSIVSNDAVFDGQLVIHAHPSRSDSTEARSPAADLGGLGCAA